MDELARYRKYVQTWLSFRSEDAALSAMEARVVEETWQHTSPQECAAIIRSKRATVPFCFWFGQSVAQAASEQQDQHDDDHDQGQSAAICPTAIIAGAHAVVSPAPEQPQRLIQHRRRFGIDKAC
jgi:hypothetical protein